METAYPLNKLADHAAENLSRKDPSKACECGPLQGREWGAVSPAFPQNYDAVEDFCWAIMTSHWTVIAERSIASMKKGYPGGLGFGVWGGGGGGGGGGFFWGGGGVAVS